MHKKFVFYMIILLALCVSGCVKYTGELSLLERRALGQEHNTYLPPDKPPETLETPDVAEPTGTITLHQALALAVMNSPELKAFSWDVRIADARQLQAGVWPNPEFAFEIAQLGGSGDLNGFNSAETTVQINQLIETGGKRNKRKNLASINKELTGWDYEAKRLDVVTDATKAFAQVLAAQRQLELTEELLQLSKNLLNTVIKRVDAGKDPPLEKTKAAIALSHTKIQYQKALQNLDQIRQQLASVWGGKNPLFERAAGNLDLLSSIPTIDELTALIEKNPDIARWSIEIDRNKALLELENANAFSDVTVSAGFQRFNELNDHAFLLGFTIPLPILDRNQGAKMAAAYSLAMAKEKQKAAYSRIHMELGKIYKRFSNAYVEATELEKNVLQGAESVFQASQVAYSQGKLDYLHVLDAQRTLFEAKAQYGEALVSFHIAKTDIERIIGQLINNTNFSTSED